MLKVLLKVFLKYYYMEIIINIADIVAIPMFLVLVIYFAQKKNKTVFELVKKPKCYLELEKK